MKLNGTEVCTAHDVLKSRQVTSLPTIMGITLTQQAALTVLQLSSRHLVVKVSTSYATADESRGKEIKVE